MRTPSEKMVARSKGRTSRHLAQAAPLPMKGLAAARCRREAQYVDLESKALEKRPMMTVMTRARRYPCRPRYL